MIRKMSVLLVQPVNQSSTEGFSSDWVKSALHLADSGLSDRPRDGLNEKKVL
jgi:hypothetical protein